MSSTRAGGAADEEHVAERSHPSRDREIGVLGDVAVRSAIPTGLEVVLVDVFEVGGVAFDHNEVR